MICTFVMASSVLFAPLQASSYILSGYVGSSVGLTSDHLKGFKIEAVGMGISTMSGQDGYFEFLNLSGNTNSLTLKISKPGYLSLLISDIFVSSDIVVALKDSPAVLWAGDITQDGAINMKDVVKLASAFNTYQGDLKFNANCDFNMDKSINMVDVTIIAKHFNKSSSDYPKVPVSYVAPTAVVPALDKFGIKELTNTVPNGRTWFSKFDQGTQRTTNWGQDSVDPELIFRGSGNYTIYGSTGERSGQMRVSGSTPRIYIRGSPSESVPPPPGTSMWNNVEVTFYAITTNSGSNVTYAGIEAVVKTNHCPDSDDCTTRGYGGRVLFDGRVDIEKECSHKNGGNKRVSTVYPWPSKGRMPLNQWIGYKLIARNCENNTKCRIEIYRDLTEGKNGGVWELLTSFIDYDGWSSDTPSCCELHKGKVLLDANYSVYLRTDGLGEQFYKWFSIREVEPLP